MRSRVQAPPLRGGRWDLVVLGGGTGGLISALVAAGAGARVALIESDRLGGECLWTGCVPSKSLLAAADLAHRMRHADRVGLGPVEPEIDFAAVMAHVRAVQKIIEPHDSAARLSAGGVHVIRGVARFDGPGVVDIQDQRLRFRKAIIATGAAPVIPTLAGLDAVNVLSTDTVWSLDRAPGALAIVGGGPVGAELAQGFARLGIPVTLLEAGPRLLPRDDPAAGEFIAARLAEEGVTVILGVSVLAVEGDRDGGELTLADGRAPVPFTHLLLAVGRAPRSAELGLESVGVATRADGAIVVDAHQRSSDRHIYAVGDVTGGPAFTHVAARQARTATVNALFGARGRADVPFPRVTYTDPEVASVGMSEAEAHERWPGAGGRRKGARRRPAGPSVTRFDYGDLDRAITDGRAAGSATLVADPRGRLVGASLVAPGAAESIAELTAWITQGAKLAKVSETPHAYPTLSEGPSRAADDYLRARVARPGAQRLLASALAILSRLDHPR